jgi:hypothetical protein
MADPLLDALRQLRDQHGAAKTLPRRQVGQGAQTPPTQHSLPHMIKFHQACVIRKREFTMVDGNLVPKGDWGPPQAIAAGEEVPRGTGIWQIEVLQGTADFEKDFIAPEGQPANRGDVED